MNSKKNDMVNSDDLNFMPLNITAPLDPNSSKFPLVFQSDGISVTKSYGNLTLGFPSFNMNPSPMPLNTTPVIQKAPLTPYPDNIPNLNTTNQNGFNSNLGSTSDDLEFPGEPNDELLYSYNQSRVDNDYLNNMVNPLDILKNFDISLDYDSDSRKGSCNEADVENIFSEIESKNPGIIATMKAYRIPYPIAKLLIKKIIKISLDNCKR